MERSLKMALLASIAALAAGCLPLVEDDGWPDGEEWCSGAPDLVADSFAFEWWEQAGTPIDLHDVVLCNWGDSDAAPGWEYAVLLSQSPDLAGTVYTLYESAPMVGVAAWECVTVEESLAVGEDVPEGYYYVTVSVDHLDDVLECDEENNWSRSDDAIHVTPAEPAADAGA